MARDLVISTTAKDFLSAKFKGIEKSLERLEVQGKKNFAGLSRAAERFNRVIGVGKALVAGFLTAKTLQFAGRQVAAVADLGDRYQKLSIELGISTEALSELEFAAARSGVEVNTLTQSIRTIIERMEEFRRTGGGAAAPVFERLGLATAIRQGRQFEELLPELAERLRRVASEQERVALATKLFEKEGVTLLRLFADGAEGLEKLRTEARNLGITFSRDAADKAAAFNDELTNLKGAFAGLRQELVLQFLPLLTDGIEQLTEFARNNRGPILEFFVSSTQAALGLAEGVAEIARSFVAVRTSVGNLSDALRVLSSPAIGGLSQLFGSRGTIGNTESLEQTKERIDGIIGSIRRLRDELDQAAVARRQSLIGPPGPRPAPAAIETPSPIGPPLPIEATVARLAAALETVRGAFDRTRDASRRTFDEIVEGAKKGGRQIVGLEQDAERLARENLLEGFQASLKTAAQEAKELGLAVQDVMATVQGSIASQGTTAIIEFAKGARTGKEAFKEFAASVVEDIARMVIQLTILKSVQAGLGAFSGGSFGAAKGGVFPGHFRPLPGLQGGGVVRRRSAFELAEAGQAEAVVPLPDNRSIPVRLVGGRSAPADSGRPSVVINMPVTFQGVRDSAELQKMRGQVKSFVIEALKQDPRFRDSVGNAA